MNTVMRVLIPLGLAAAMCGSAAYAQDNVLFLNGGYPELCATAARNIDNPKKIEITGSRLNIPALELCTLAIRNADANTSNLSGSYNNRGVVLFAQGSFDEALRDFEEAIQLEETLAQAHVNRGYTLVALGRWADSIAAFDRGIALGADELAKAHFNRGIAHEEVGNLRQAYLDYLKASELDPQWEDPQQELSRFTVPGP